MSSRIAIIPARGGSRRLPRKNVLPFRGKPMLVHPIHVCLESGLFDRVIVSTEDEEIAQAARAAGAEVADRPDALATDRASIADVCVGLLTQLSSEGYHPSLFCCVFATAVFLSPADIHNALALVDRDPPADIVMGVSEFSLQPQQALYEDGAFLVPMWPDLVKRKSQEMPRFVASNGTLLWVRTRPFVNFGQFPVERLRGYEIPRLRAVDIDTEDDYLFAKAIAEMKERIR